MRKVYIYGLIDPNNNRIKYIGKTIVEPINRMKQHIYEAKRNQRTGKDLWLMGLIDANLMPKVIVLEETNKVQWKDKEKYWIKFYGLDSLTNTREGGDGSFSHSTEAKNKISISSRKRWKNEDYREKLSKSQRENWENNDDRREYIGRLSKEKWDNSSKKERKRRCDKISKKRLEYLSSMSEEEKSTWKNNMRKSRESRSSEKEEYIRKKNSEAQKLYWNTKENRERQRKKAIQGWNNFTEKQKEERSKKISVSTKRRFANMTEEERKEFGRKVSIGKQKKKISNNK